MSTSVHYLDTLLKIENVNLSYQGTPVLKNVNAEIRDLVRDTPGCITGQIVAFLGPSGRGKTQLFRIIAGLNQPDSGRVILNATKQAVRAGEVGVVSQNYLVFPWRSVWSNLMLAAHKTHKTDKEAIDQIMYYVDAFGMKDYLGLYPEQLSGGQRQRIAIMQQLLCSEHFLLMDEPFSGLDIIVKEKVQAMITKFTNLHELNTTIIVSHDIASVCAIADHVWLLGREQPEVPGSSIREVYDLVERDLCWHPEITTDPRFHAFIHEVEEKFRTL